MRDDSSAGAPGRPGAQRRAAFAGPVTMVLLVACGASLLSCGPTELHGIPIRPKKPAPEITVAEPDGGPFRLSDQRGRVVVLAFGDTSCKNVCPATLSKMRQVYQALGPARGDRTLMIFVAVDPERDTPDRLREIVGAQDPRILGLHPTGAALSATLLAYGIHARAHDQEAARDDTPSPSGPSSAVEPGSAYLVIDKEGDLRLRFPASARVEDMAADLGALVKEGEPPWSLPFSGPDGGWELPFLE